jgi:hypothetical protein
VDVAKLDQDVAIVIHGCCKRVSPMFHLFVLWMYVASVSDACLKCFVCLLLYVASVASGCFKSRSDVALVAMVFQLYVLNVLSVLDVYCKYFIWM